MAQYISRLGCDTTMITTITGIAFLCALVACSWHYHKFHIDQRRAFNTVRLTPQNYGLSNSTMGFKGYCASRISQCESLWANLSSSDPLKEEKLWAVAIFMYTNKGTGGKNLRFYSQLNSSLRDGKPTYSVYTKILTEDYIIEQQKLCPDTLYRGICLPKLVALQYENQNFSNFKVSNQFSSFTTKKSVADKFANCSFNHDQCGNTVPTVLQLTRAKLAYIGDYGIASETEWLAPPGMHYNVGNWSTVPVGGHQGRQVNLTPVNQRHRLALQMKFVMS